MSNTVYSIVTEKILAELQKGVVPWRKPWLAGIPQNMVSKRAYTGMNSILLSFSPYSSPYWLTFKQCQAQGGTVKKGEKSTLIIFWAPIASKKNSEEKGADEEKKSSFMLRYYHVFNVEQCIGLTLPEEKKEPIEPLAACDSIIAKYLDAPPVITGGHVACYIPKRDEVNMPAKQSFDAAEGYYATLFHELAHSTGHEKRLKREGIEAVAPFGSETYSKEELIAEFGAAFLCATAGIAPAILENSASYIDNWMKALKQDSKLLMQAASKAQKAADWIQGIKKENESKE